MALINCKECGAEVSDKALDCPKCGARLRKPQRTFFGKLIKYSFIGFNVLMLLWMIFGVGGAASTIDTNASDAEVAGAAIGTGIGAMFVLFIWVAGDIVLGLMTLLTRPKK
ncbi:MAG: zinc ribbon domain-containing protein [Ignavibacteria bacterium]